MSAAQDVEMFTSSLSAEQQRELARRLTGFLSQYSRISDSYIIVRIDHLLLLQFAMSEENLLCLETFLTHVALVTYVFMVPSPYRPHCILDHVHLKFVSTKY